MAKINKARKLPRTFEQEYRYTRESDKQAVLLERKMARRQKRADHRAWAVAR